MVRLWSGAYVNPGFVSSVKPSGPTSTDVSMSNGSMFLEAEQATAVMERIDPSANRPSDDEEARGHLMAVWFTFSQSTPEEREVVARTLSLLATRQGLDVRFEEVPSGG